MSAFEEVKNELGWRDVADERFLALSGSSESEFRVQCPTVVSETGSERVLHSILPPKPVSDSVDLTTILFAAEHTSSSPVFTDPAHRAELSYRYTQYKAGLATLSAHLKAERAPDEFLDQFGSVTFQIANSAIESSQIGQFSIKEIVELREAMDDSRPRFVSEHLVEATSLVEDNPWSRQVTSELERFVRGRLATELQNYEEAATKRIEQLSARRKGHLIDAASFAAGAA